MPARYPLAQPMPLTVPTFLGVETCASIAL